MEVVSLDLQSAELLGRDLLAGRITTTIESRADDEATAVGRVAVEVDDRFVRAQRTAAPVDRNEGEHPVLDLVPLAGAGREVTDVDREGEFVGEPLKFGLPHTRSVAVATTSISGDEDLACIGVTFLADLLPPRVDRGDGEYRRVVIDAHADEAVVGGEIVHAVRDRFADGVAGKVVDIYQFRLALRLPLAAPVLEVADQLLLLRVDGDDRHAALDAVLGLGVDVLELRVAIGMLLALDGLVRCLEAVIVFLQQLRDCLVADANPEPREHLGRQHVRALACPPQRRLRVAPRHRIDELLQRGPHLRMRDFVRSLPRAAPNLDDVRRPRTGACLVPALANRADRHAGRARHRGHAAVPDRARLGACPQPPRSLIHGRLQQAPLLANRLLRVHCERRSRRAAPCRSPEIHFGTRLDRLTHSGALRARMDNSACSRRPSCSCTYSWPLRPRHRVSTYRPRMADYDLVVIGAGAAGEK